MGSVSVRERISNYVKKIISRSIGVLCTILLIVGMGTGLVIQHTSYTFDKLRYQQDMLDMMNFNQQLMNSKFKLNKDIDQLNIQMYNMDQIMKQLYNRLKRYENLPPLPGQPEDDSRSDA